MQKKFEVMMAHIEELIAQSQLKQGERLPSIRAMAAQYQCNKATIIRAYQALEAKHKIYAIPKGGYYLIERKNPQNLDYGTIDFTEVMPDPKLLPYREFNHCINKAVELYQDDLFTYGHEQGLQSLKKTLVSHLADRQVFASEKGIVITSGAQQALNILAAMDFPNGKEKILVEQPTYGLMHQLAELKGQQLVGIRRSVNGLDLNELERIFRTEPIKFFYTIPRLHNPLGTSLTEKEKERIVALAKQYHVYIVEDDYLSDLDPNSKSLPAYYYDLSGRVIYIKSFSKAFMPGIRIGAAVMNETLKETFLKHKKCDDLSTSVLAQGALEIFINSGMYTKHIKKARAAYSKKMHYLGECLKEIRPLQMEVYLPPTGFFAWIRFSDKIDRNLLISRLKEKNIYLSSPDAHFIGGKATENAFRICVSKLNLEQIRTGVRVLCQVASMLDK